MKMMHPTYLRLRESMVPLQVYKAIKSGMVLAEAFSGEAKANQWPSPLPVSYTCTYSWYAGSMKSTILVEIKLHHERFGTHYERVCMRTM